jgi:transcription antitermination factor NusG
MSDSDDALSIDVPEPPGDLREAAAEVPGQWYVAHTRSRQEKILVTELSRLAVFNYLPLVRRTTRSPNTRRFSRSVVPVFPGYVFFKGTEEQRYIALRTNRVANVLEVPGQEQLLAELVQIQHLLASTDAFAIGRRLKVGDWARIIAGPLQGLEGIVVRHSGRLRLTLNVTILGQSASVEVEHDVVERIEPPDYAFSSG